MIDRRSRIAATLGSRWNLAGTSGAIAGVVAHLVGLVGPEWPVLSLGCYGLGASLAWLTGPRAPDPVATQLAALRATVARCRAVSRSLSTVPAADLEALLAVAEEVVALPDGEVPDAYLRRDEVLAILTGIEGALQRSAAVDEAHRAEADRLLVAVIRGRLVAMRWLLRDRSSGIDELRAYVRALPGGPDPSDDRAPPS